MGIWKKTLFLVLLIVAFVFISLNFFLALRGKSLIIETLGNLTQREVSIKKVNIRPLFNLHIKGLHIQGLARIDSLYLTPSILGIVAGNIAFNNIKMVSPEFTYEKSRPKTAPVKEEDEAVASFGQKQAAAAKKKAPLRLILKRLKIRDGRVNFIDQTVGQKALTITVKDLNLSLYNLLLFPKSKKANFKLTGKIPWKDSSGEGRLELSGWIDLFKKDMQAKIEINDIDGVHLYPYYAHWVDLEKSRIREAKLQFKSDITGENNDIVAECHLELTDIVFRDKDTDGEEDDDYKIAAAVLDFFKAMNKGVISIDFTIRTKMDRPEFGFRNIQAAVEDKIAQTRSSRGAQYVAQLPVDLFSETVKGAKDITSALIDGVMQMGGILIGPFKKEQREYN